MIKTNLCRISFPHHTPESIIILFPSKLNFFIKYFTLIFVLQYIYLIHSSGLKEFAISATKPGTKVSLDINKESYYIFISSKWLNNLQLSHFDVCILHGLRLSPHTKVDFLCLSSYLQTELILDYTGGINH